MSRHRLVRVLGGLGALSALLVVVLLSGSFPPGASEARQAAAQPKPAKPQRPADRGPLSMTTAGVSLEIELGIKDKEQTVWEGDIKVSEGRIVSAEIARGGVQSRIDGGKFSVRHRRLMMTNLLTPVLRVNLDAPLTAEITLKTKQGEVTSKLADLPHEGPKKFLDDQVAIERQEPALRLTGVGADDDYPALAKGPDGTIWLAYVEYLPGKTIVNERVLGGEFDDLMPKNNGDCIRLVRFDGKTFSPPIDVTDIGLDVWRPTVAVDQKKGCPLIAWAQQVEGDWDIHFRCYTPPGAGRPQGGWSPVIRIPSPGSDFHVVSAPSQVAGEISLAWQSWRGDNFEIMQARVLMDTLIGEPKVVSSSKGNDWTPAIATDSKGNTYIAWDTYDKGNYDVMLAAIGPEGKATTQVIAGSPRFEARPSILCDAQDRLWIAYEEGDVEWGKDFSTNQFQRIPLDKNPGNPLYGARTIQVKCLVDGKLMQPAGDLGKVLKEKLPRSESLPRLALDKAGGLWLLFRHHPQALGAGETWHSFALRYHGDHWSGPRRLANSSNLLDNRPGVIGFGTGILAVYSSDNRSRTQNREQTDLFASVLQPANTSPVTTELQADRPIPVEKVALVHPNEKADVARMREYRVDAGGKKLQLIRGEFHRHTEYTAHRDQDGTLEDSFRYGLDAGGLDWMGNGDHDNGAGHEYMWWQIQKFTDLVNNPPHFSAAQTYERSAVYPNGHRNVIMPKRGIRPLPRGTLMGTPEKGTPDTKVLYAYLKHFGGICASHTSATNMGTDWRDNDPLVEPIVEIYQGHRHNYEHPKAPRAPTAETQIGGYRPDGYVWNALEKGHRFGFQSSSDHISVHMSYAVALAEENSRQSLIDAFKKRHCYAATDNIILIVRSGQHLMGDAFETKDRPELEIMVQGTQPIAKVHVIRDNKYVSSTEPKEKNITFRYRDMDAEPGKTSYYYVRVEQADGNLAWGSPMWITYKQ